MTDEKETHVDFETIELCSNPRTTEFLPGLVDVSVCFDADGNYIDNGINISLPVCMLSFISVTQEMDLERRLLNESKKRKSDEVTVLENVYNDISGNYIKYMDNPDSLKELSKEELNKIHIILDNYKNLLPKIGKYIESNELWALLEV